MIERRTGDPTADSPQRQPKAQVHLALRLPRDRLSVPVVRHLAQDALREFGAESNDIHDIELALAEACSNVMHHAGPGETYDVEVVIGPDDCVIRVISRGGEFDPAQVLPGMAGPEAEGGRGVPLMRKLMDDVRVIAEPDRGTVVQLVKSLHFVTGTPGDQFFSTKR